MPSVCVITPNYNYSLYIEDAILSVLDQTVAPDEYFVVDDCSTDNSSEIIKAIDGNFTFIENKENLGIVENFRQCVARSKSDYVCFIGADNVIDPTYIQKLKYSLDQSENLAVAYSDIIIFGPLSKDLAGRVNAVKINSAPGDHRYHWKFPEPTEENLAQLELENFINGSAMFRRSAYEAVGGYRKTESPEDADLFLRMIKAGYSAAHVPEPLLYYRQHSREQANSKLLHDAQIKELTNSLNDSRAWSHKLQSDINELLAYARKLEGDIDELRSALLVLEKQTDSS